MGIFDYFRSKKKTANIAKDRLQLVIAHERSTRNGPDYLPQLKQDLLNVIRKYVPIDEDQMSVLFDKQDSLEVLELNITLNEKP